MNTMILSSTSGLWRRTARAASGAALTLGLLALAPAAQAQNQTIYGITPGGGSLISFSLPLAGLPAILPITGVNASQSLVGIDSRPATGELFAFGYDAANQLGQLYVIDKTTGAATAVGTALALPLGGPAAQIGFDFNPTVDRIRVTSSNTASYRLNPNNGAVVQPDGNLKFPDTASGTPAVGSVAYTNSFIGASGTTLYDIDESRSTLYIQSPPNDGVLTAGVPVLNTSAPLLSSANQTDFDIYTDPTTRAQTALLAVSGGTVAPGMPRLGTGFYSLNLTTGDASLISGGVPGIFISDIAFGIDRTAPAVSGQLLYAVSTNNNLLSFYSGTPNYINSAVAITGIAAGQTLVGTDFRPNTGELFGLGYDPATAQGRLYLINQTTAVATPIGTGPVPLALGSTAAELNAIGFDFNPTVDRIRVTGLTTKNYRLNPNNGAVAATDGDLNFVAGATGTPTIGAVAYTNSYAGSTATTLYDIDDVRNQLFIQSNPNLGQLTALGGTGLLPAASAVNDLDFYYDAASQLNQGFVVSNGAGTFSTLYTLAVTATSAATTEVGVVGLGISVRDVSARIAPLTQPTLVGQLLYGVAGGNLVSFDSSNPTNIRRAVNITGLPATQVLAGLDFSPATGELFGLGYNAAANATDPNAQLYKLDISTDPSAGALTAIGGPIRLELGATASGIGFDFNPTVNLIRVVSANNQANYRVNPTTGAITLRDTDLTNPNNANAPAISGAAYTNNDNNANTGTALYGYDQTANVLVQAALTATATPGSNAANNGTYVNVGTGSGITVSAAGVDFDIYADVTNPATPVNSAFLVAAPTGTTTDNLYTVSLTAGTVSLVGRIGNGSNLTGLAASLTPAPLIVAGLTWTGAVSTDWGVAGNWTPAQVPTATDNVTIPNVANDPVVNSAQVANGVTLASGATLTTANGGTLTLSGSFTNNGGTTLGSGSGTIAFNGTAAQTVSGTTTFFNNLTVGAAGLTASTPVQVQRVLQLNGNLASNGNLTLLSNATGTAHVVNAPGTVAGTATVQRYIDGSLNGGAGYRHYSAPVSGSTVGDLATSGFTPVVNPAYNTAGNTATPFPTVFGYDETRVNTSGNPAPQDFDKGFFSPNSLADPLAVARGYTVNVLASQTVDFVGTLNNGNYDASGLSRGTQTESGWQLLGNPYPSPINWNSVGRTNVDAAVYVYRSTGQYAGTYSTYVAGGTGTNGGTSTIGSGQGIFVRVSTPGTANGQVSFANAARLTDYTSPIFQRGADTAPLVRFDLRGTTGPADEAVVYFDGNATAGFDSSLDAYKLIGGNGPLVATETAAPLTALSINALPALGTTDVVVNLRLQAGEAGAYTLRVTELLRLPAGTFAYLRDAQTGTNVDLVAQPSYSFQLPAGVSAGRFSLLISQRTVLATAPSAVSQQVSVYPNPARDAVTISLPAALARQATQVQLVNALGQVVLRATLPAGNARPVSLAGIARGVYTVRMQTEQGTVNKRLVIE